MIEESTLYQTIGERILINHPDFEDLVLAGARIAYLVSDEIKKKNRKIVFADCRTVQEQYKWCCDYDFMITVYQPNVDMFDFDDEQLNILIEHELRHCGIDTDKDEPSFYIVPHDIEEFNAIIDRYGMDWQTRKDK